jgi:hypothetical protein
MLDFNSSEYEIKEPVSIEGILSLYSDYQIFKFYIPNLILGGIMNSPLREDNNPSFSVFYSKRYGKLLFNDFSTNEKGDVFVFVSKLFNINYYEALCKICIDFNITKFAIKNSDKLSKTKGIIEKHFSNIKESTIIKIKKKNFTDFDLKFWKQFNILTDTLHKFNVVRCEYVFIGDKIIKSQDNDPIYCYLERKDGVITYKLYRPFSEKYRFINNRDNSIWDGWEQLPDKGDLLIITKSRKDIMSIYETCNIYSTCLNSEGVLPKKPVVNQLKKRFKQIYIFYDNDCNKKTNKGRIFAKKFSKTFKIPFIEIPDHLVIRYNAKDFSDLVKNSNPHFAKTILQNLILCHQTSLIK